jgi:hypothetical protein
MPTVPAPNHNITKCEHYDIYRRYMMREDDLINHRLGWNLAIQGFLFATYGLSVQKLAEIHTKALVERGRETADQLLHSLDVAPLHLLVTVIPWVGVLMAFFVWLAVVAAKIALEQLHEDWKEKIRPKYPEEPHLPDVAGAGVSMAVRLGFYAPLVIPLTFVVAWLFIAFSAMR